MGDGDERIAQSQTVKLQQRIAQLEQQLALHTAAQALAADAPSPILLLDLEGRIEFASHPVSAIAPGQLTGRCLDEVVGKEFRLAVRHALSQCQASGQPARYETGWTLPNGELTWWQSTVGRTRLQSGQPGFLVVSADVTDRRATADEHERFFRLSVDMMCVAGFDGYFKRVNHAFQTALGYGAELLERPYLTFVHPEDRERTQLVTNQMLSGEPVHEFVNRYRAADNTYRLLHWHGVGDPERRLIYAVARDDTNRRQREDKTRQSNKLEAIGQLAGGIAHDFNNLLMAIDANIQWAMEEPETAGECLHDASLASKRAAALTRQLLTFSRRQTLSKNVVALDTLLNRVMGLLTRLLPENINVDVRLNNALVTVFADESQMEQVVLNLCLNARDAMVGGGEMAIEVDRTYLEGPIPGVPRSDRGHYVRLTVQDSGGGMPPEVSAHIFEPFFTTKATGKGTGLGLATVSAIVQTYGGFVQVESQVGRGTRVTVYLPASEDKRAASASSLNLCASPPGAGETILVAEDDPSVRAVVVRMLAAAGYQVLTANDGSSAAELFRENAARVSLVLLDVVMPRLGGMECAAQIRLLKPAVPIIFASGYIQNPEDELQLAHESTLTKPYERQHLLRLVRQKLLQQQVTSAQAPVPHSAAVELLTAPPPARDGSYRS